MPATQRKCIYWGLKLDVDRYYIGSVTATTHQEKSITLESTTERTNCFNKIVEGTFYLNKLFSCFFFSFLSFSSRTRVCIHVRLPQMCGFFWHKSCPERAPAEEHCTGSTWSTVVGNGASVSPEPRYGVRHAPRLQPGKFLQVHNGTDDLRYLRQTRTRWNG